MFKNYNSLEEKIIDKTKKLSIEIINNQKDANSGFDVMSKDMFKMKHELSEMIENKFDASMRNLELQTKALKEDYENNSRTLKEATDGLLESFNEKVVKIKETAATFFAKTEAQVTENIT